MKKLRHCHPMYSR